MASKLARLAGSQVARQALRKHSGVGGALDLRFGIQLLRDRRIPVPTKLAALALGGLLTWLLIAAETPLELILGALLPLGGFALDMMVDGAELLVCPVLFAALLLPYLAPRPLVDEVRGLQPQTVLAS